MLREMALALGGMTLVGCADTAAMRTLASNTETAIGAHSGEINAFVASESSVNAANASMLADLAAQTASEHEASTRRLDAWTIAGRKDLTTEFAVVSRIQPPDILASLNAASPPPQTLGDGGSVAALTLVNKQLAGLAKPPTTGDQAVEFYQSMVALYQSYKSLRAAAASAPANPPAAGPAVPPAK